MSREKMPTPDIETEEKRKKALRDTARQLRSFHKKLLKSRGGKPLPDSVPDLLEIREGRVVTGVHMRRVARGQPAGAPAPRPRSG